MMNFHNLAREYYYVFLVAIVWKQNVSWLIPYMNKTTLSSYDISCINIIIIAYLTGLYHVSTTTSYHS